MVIPQGSKGMKRNLLNKVFELCHLLAQFLNGDLLVLHSAHQLQFVDSISYRNKLGGSPQETVHFDGDTGLLHGFHVSFVIPWLHVKQDRGFGDNFGFLCLLLLVCLFALLWNSLLLFIIFLFIRTEEIDIIVIVTSSCGGGSCLWLSSR